VIVVSNSTALIGLAKIGKIYLLREIFSRIYIPEEVYKEVTEAGRNRPGSDAIRNAEWIETKIVEDRTQVNLLMASLDEGEAEVLALSKELRADLILLDEEKARKSAVIAGFEVMGLLGVLVIAKNLGLIEIISPLIEELKNKSFRISDRVIAEALLKTGETFSNK
jgi:predicted nucleic acid-binding protein